MDHVSWDIIDSKRAQEGWLPVAKMGLLQNVPGMALSARLSVLAAGNATQRAALEAARKLVEGGRETEIFDRRQPEHIILASMIGLGVFNAHDINHRVVDLQV